MVLVVVSSNCLELRVASQVTTAEGRVRLNYDAIVGVVSNNGVMAMSNRVLQLVHCWHNDGGSSSITQ